MMLEQLQLCFKIMIIASATLIFRRNFSSQYCQHLHLSHPWWRSLINSSSNSSKQWALPRARPSFLRWIVWASSQNRKWESSVALMTYLDSNYFLMSSSIWWSCNNSSSNKEIYNSQTWSVELLRITLSSSRRIKRRKSSSKMSSSKGLTATVCLTKTRSSGCNSSGTRKTGTITTMLAYSQAIMKAAVITTRTFIEIKCSISPNQWVKGNITALSLNITLDNNKFSLTQRVKAWEIVLSWTKELQQVLIIYLEVGISITLSQLLVTNQHLDSTVLIILTILNSYHLLWIITMEVDLLSKTNHISISLNPRWIIMITYIPPRFNLPKRKFQERFMVTEVLIPA